MPSVVLTNCPPPHPQPGQRSVTVPALWAMPESPPLPRPSSPTPPAALFPVQGEQMVRAWWPLCPPLPPSDFKHSSNPQGPPHFSSPSISQVPFAPATLVSKPFFQCQAGWHLKTFAHAVPSTWNAVLFRLSPYLPPVPDPGSNITSSKRPACSEIKLLPPSPSVCLFHFFPA